MLGENVPVSNKIQKYIYVICIFGVKPISKLKKKTANKKDIDHSSSIITESNYTE